MTSTIHAHAEEIASALRAVDGISVSVEHSTNRFSQDSSYLVARAAAGRFFADFRVRVSDHEISSGRQVREEYQHYILDRASEEQMTAMLDMARRAVAHVQSRSAA